LACIPIPLIFKFNFNVFASELTDSPADTAGTRWVVFRLQMENSRIPHDILVRRTLKGNLLLNRE
jgi:hypothetical protein